VSLLLQNTGALPWMFGTQPETMPKLFSEAAVFSIADTKIPVVDLVVVGLAFVLLVALQWLVFRTRLGTAMRAVSFDERTAALMGIHVDRVISITFAIGSAMAAAGGVFYGLRYNQLTQTADAMWVLLGLKAFVAAVVGGIGNVRGAVAGAFLIAFIANFGAAYGSPHLRDVYVFGILIGVLLVKPGGLLGQATAEKV
jgi:branched-chain amino acid transport system permease protein